MSKEIKMTDNFRFCNEDFLELFCYNPSPFYNQFNIEDATISLLDSMGEHPKCHVVFKYNPEKRIRATFVVFDDDLQEMDVKCICILFHGHRADCHCYFYEVYEDTTIGCIQVMSGYNTDRNVLKTNVGENIDEYFSFLCARFDKPEIKSTTMLYFKEFDNCFRLLDMIMSELPQRSVPLLGGEPDVEIKTYNGIKYIFFRSKVDASFLVARTEDSINPTDILLDDINYLK